MIESFQPSTSVATENCIDPDNTSISFGTIYDTPRYQLDGVGFSLNPSYESAYISNLDMGYIFPAIAESINDASSIIQIDRNKYVCDPLKDVGIKYPSLKLPQGGATTEQISSAFQSMLNEVIVGENLSKELDSIIKKSWLKIL